MDLVLTNRLKFDRKPISAIGIIFNFQFNGTGLSKINVNICKWVLTEVQLYGSDKLAYLGFFNY